MKKTTKFLLVLAAVVAMTIGAMSTVMAADITIADWHGDAKNGYTATDTNGNTVKAGWAVDGSSGLWYYFVNGKMASNRFITTAGKTYFVNADGVMHTGWMEFDGKLEVTVNNGSAKYNVASALRQTSKKVGTGTAFAEKTRYATVWSYFDEKGVMSRDTFTKIDGVWYYFDGAFAVMGEWKQPVTTIVNNVSNTSFYGFDASGAMLAGWIAYDKTTSSGGSAGQWSGTPYETGATAATTSTTSYWVYYAPSGELRTANGWLKDSNNDWFYMQTNADLTEIATVPVAVTDKYVIDHNGFGFYFDESGYMWTGDRTFSNTTNSDTKIEVLVCDGAAGTNLTDGEDIIIKANSDLTLTFNENGQALTGLQNTQYFEDLKGTKWEIIEELDANDQFVVTAKAIDNKAQGVQWAEETFLLVTTDAKGNQVAYYFVFGEMIKNEVIPFDGKVLAFGADGKAITTKTTIDGIEYTPSTTDKICGVAYSIAK